MMQMVKKLAAPWPTMVLIAWVGSLLGALFPVPEPQAADAAAG